MPSDSNTDNDLSLGSHCPAPHGKFPLKRLEAAIHRIIGVAVPLHLNILSKQKDNIQKFQTQRQWDKLHIEQLNASRTVQQLKADLHELDNVRSQVCVKDTKAFEDQVRPVQEDVIQRVHSFTELYLKPREASASGIWFEIPDGNGSTDSPAHQEDTLEVQEHILENEIPNNTAAFKSWNALKKDLIDLNSMLHTFSRLVFEQKETVQSIADNVTQAEENVSAGTRSLKKAVQLQKALLPVTGALLGIAVGGPLGLVIGAKMGFACALGGSLLGFTGARVLQRKAPLTKNSATDEGIELKDIPAALHPDSKQCNSLVPNCKED